MNLLRVLPLLGVLGLLVVLRAEEGRPLITTYGDRDTGGSGVYWTGAQDERGVLYFGCDSVLTFDGERWTGHSVPGSYGVRALAVGAGGRLWVGAANQLGYFDRTPQGTLSAYHSLNAQLPPDAGAVGDVWHVFARGNGAVFITSHSVLLWNGVRFVVHQLAGSRRLVALQFEGRIYISHLPTGLWQLEGDELRPFVPTDALGQSAAMGLARQGDGWLLATTAGLRNWNGAQLQDVPSAASRFIGENVLTSVCRTAHGDWCVGTLDHGVAVFDRDGGWKQRLVGPDILPSSSVMFVFGDRAGALWLGTSLGLTRVVPGGAVSVFDQSLGLAGRPCHRLAQAADRLVVATDGGIFQLRLGPAGPGRFDPIESLSGYYFDVLGAADGVYAAGYKGVYRWDGEKVIAIFSTRSDVFSFRRSVAQPASFLLADEDKLVRLAPQPDGSLAPSVLAHLPDSPLEIAEDTHAAVWVGTSSGSVFRVPVSAGPDGGFEVLPATPSPGPSRVARVGRSIVVCTTDGIRLYDATSRRATSVVAAPQRGATAISNPGPDGSVWVALLSPFTDGFRLPMLGRLQPEPNGAIAWHALAVDGLKRIGGVKSLFIDSRGIVWIGGPDGLLRVTPDGVEEVAAPPPPVLRGDMPAGARLPYNRNSAAFEFAAVEYSRRESVRFQTRLSDGGSGWSAPTNASQLTLAGLREGDYEFAVRTINDAGLASPPATWRFIVLPPWYRTNSAYAGWGLLMLLGSLGIVQWRSAYLRRQNLRLEGLVQKKTAQLEKANAAKSEFLANMSHEIRNPISGIAGLSLALEETPLDARQRQLADSIRSCAGLLATLVDDVLDFAKIEAGKIELRPTAFDLRASLEQCVAMVAEDARRAGSAITIDLDPAVPAQPFGDAARVQQIVLNFLTNAVKFGLGQPITVAAAPAGGGRIRLAVHDRGPGMTAPEAATLFTKFARLDRARADNIRGTGLGLAVCRLLAEKMGGEVGVESTPGRGSCFWAELPLAPAAAPAPAPPAALAAGPRLRALIAEDIDYNATAMQAVLRRLGIDSDVATDGPTALEHLQTTAYDVAFMDWNLPGMIGTDVVRQYRAVEPPNRRTVIIATTAYSGDFNREACLAAGMDAFIAKPFTPEKIAAALGDLRGSLRAAASVVVSPPPSVAPPEDEVDLQMLRFLADETPDGLAHQIDRYLTVFADDLSQLRALLPTGEATEIHRRAHRLVSHASAVKYAPLVRLAAELQAQTGRVDRSNLGGLLDNFDGEFARFRKILDSYRSSTGSA